jgi:hypothetical protein
MGHARIGRWRAKDCLVRDARSDRLGHLVVDLQDDPLRTIFAVRGLVFLSDDRERFEDVARVITVDPVEVEEGGVQLAADQETACVVAAELWLVLARVSGKACDVLSG